MPTKTFLNGFKKGFREAWKPFAEGFNEVSPFTRRGWHTYFHPWKLLKEAKPADIMAPLPHLSTVSFDDVGSQLPAYWTKAVQAAKDTAVEVARH